MIHNNQTVNIDGTVLKNEEFIKAFSFDKDDKFSQWVVRPLAILTTVGIGISMFLASAFLIVISLAMIPLVAVAFWAMKTKIQRDMAKSDPVVTTQSPAEQEPADDTQTTG